MILLTHEDYQTKAYKACGGGSGSRVCCFPQKEQRKQRQKQRTFRCYFRFRTFGSTGFPPKM